jgi:Na+/proline symporter
MALNGLDWSIIAGYFLLTLGIGVAFSARAGRSLSEYFVSGRAMPWWLAGTSMVATTFAADTPLAVTSMVAKNGLAGNWFWWSLAVGGMFTVFVFARLWRRSEVLTDVELVELRYGGRPAAALRAIRALYISLVVNPIVIGWVTGAMVTVLKGTVLSGAGTGGEDASVITPWWRGDWAIIAGSLAVVGVYCTLAGLWGVAAADFLQFFVAMAGCVALAVVAVNHVGGMDRLVERVNANYGNGEQAFRFMPDFSASDPWLPLHVFCIYLFVQWWATWYPGAEPGGGGYIVQRMASCKDERHAVLATLWYQWAHYCLRPWPWLLVAFVSLAMFPEIRQAALAPPAPGATQIKPDVGFAWVMRDVSPHGLRGLMLVTFFAAFMSTISTQMNWGASYLVCDVYQRFFAAGADQRHLTRVSRLVSVFVLLIGGIAAYVMRDITVDDAWRMLAALGAGTGAVYMLRWFWWRINAWTEIAAMLSSLLYYLMLTKWVERLTLQQARGELPSGSWSAEWIAEANRPEVQSVVVALLTIITWLLVTYLTPAERPEVLERFYRKVRPGGPGWRPVAARLPEVAADQHLASSILASLLGVAVVYLTLPSIGWILFGQYRQAAWGLTGAALAAAAIYALLRRIGWAKIVT